MANNTETLLKYRGIAYKSESITLKYLLKQIKSDNKKEFEKKLDQAKLSGQEIFWYSWKMCPAFVIDNWYDAVFWHTSQLYKIR